MLTPEDSKRVADAAIKEMREISQAIHSKIEDSNINLDISREVSVFLFNELKPMIIDFLFFIEQTFKYDKDITIKK